MVNLKISNTLSGKRWTGIGWLLLLLLVFAGGCSSLSGNQDQRLNAANSSTRKTGALLWSENCNRCHNVRPPDSYNDVQWDVAMLHMRVRANLTAEDAHAIQEYLRSAN